MRALDAVRASVKKQLFLATALAATPGWLLAQTSDPFPEPIPYGDITAELIPFAEIPGVDDEAPRMNQLAPSYDGTGRVFVNDQRGPMYAISPNGEEVTEYLNLAELDPMLTGGFEGGFQSFAFHPEFADNGKLYTLHGSFDTAPAPTFRSVSPDPQLHMVLLEWTDDEPFSDFYEGGLPREVLRIEQGSNTHYGGGMTFNYAVEPDHPDFGKLYLAAGDGDEPVASQEADLATGSILRIDPFGENGRNGRYGVPEDNPFVEELGPLPEAWAIGLRNPQRISFDPIGEIDTPFISDIGEDTIEEINLGFPGANYGWPVREGSFEPVEDRLVIESETPDGFVDPLAEYDHDEGFAVTGGYVVRGEGPEELQGKYVFGDIPTGRIFYVDAYADEPLGQEGILELRLTDEDGFATTLRDELGEPRADLRFGLGAEGELFVLNKHDGVIRLLANGAPAVPEPSGAWLLAAALAGVAVRQR